MAQLVKFNSTPSLFSVFENIWGNDLSNYDMLSKAKLPAINVKDKEKEYEIEVAAPGFKKEDFNIFIENRVLTISAEEKDEKEVKEDKYTRREFVTSSFTRSFALPDNIDEEQIHGHYDKGVLYVILPKTQEKMPEKKAITLN